jgi:hypothetical protein
MVAPAGRVRVAAVARRRSEIKRVTGTGYRQAAPAIQLHVVQSDLQPGTPRLAYPEAASFPNPAFRPPRYRGTEAGMAIGFDSGPPRYVTPWRKPSDCAPQACLRDGRSSRGSPPATSTSRSSLRPRRAASPSRIAMTGHGAVPCHGGSPVSLRAQRSNLPRAAGTGRSLRYARNDRASPPVPPAWKGSIPMRCNIRAQHRRMFAATKLVFQAPLACRFVYAPPGPPHPRPKEPRHGPDRPQREAGARP